MVLTRARVVIGTVGITQFRGTLRRNPLAGVRTTETMASDAAWYAAHAATARLIIAAGFILATCGVTVLWFYPTDDTTVSAVVLLGAAFVALVLAVWAGVKGHRIAQPVNMHQR